MPPPLRVSPAVAAHLLERWSARATSVHVLSPQGYLSAIARAPAEGVQGGQIYDALILAAAEEAGVDTLLTFNERHFRGLRSAKAAIVRPCL
ncbi:MAG: hypothetical protein ACKVVT_05495 [Dehalococcoidia bacterium]